MGSGAQPVEAEIVQCCTALTNAIRDRDDAVLAGLVTDDFVFTTDRGRWGKEYFMANVQRWDTVSMDFHDVLVRDFGEVAVMHARVRTERQALLAGQEMSGELYLTDMWERQDGNRRLVSRQWSRANSPQVQSS